MTETIVRPKSSRAEYLREWAKKNPEKCRARAARYRVKHPDKCKANMGRWRSANIQHEAAYRANYEATKRGDRTEYKRADYQKNSEHYCAKAKQWRADNPIQVRINKRTRRARINGAGGKHTKAQIDALFVAQNKKCANPFCMLDLTETNRHLDHIQPISKGGHNSNGNLQWLCIRCNQRKNAQSWKEWLDREAALHQDHAS